MNEQTIYTDKPTEYINPTTYDLPEQDIALLDIAQMVVEQNGYKATETAIDDVERLYQYECLVCGYTEIPRNIITTLVGVLCNKKSRLK